MSKGDDQVWSALRAAPLNKGGKGEEVAFSVDVSDYAMLLETTAEAAEAQAAHFRARGHTVTVTALGPIAAPQASTKALTEHDAESLRMIASWMDRDGISDAAALLRRLAAEPAPLNEGGKGEGVRDALAHLVHGMRWWARQEDGIPAEVAPAFNQAMLVLGWSYSSQTDLDALAAEQPSEDKRDAERWRAVEPSLRIDVDDVEEGDYKPSSYFSFLSVDESRDSVAGQHETPVAWADAAIAAAAIAKGEGK